MVGEALPSSPSTQSLALDAEVLQAAARKEAEQTDGLSAQGRRARGGRAFVQHKAEHLCTRQDICAQRSRAFVRAEAEGLWLVCTMGQVTERQSVSVRKEAEHVWAFCKRLQELQSQAQDWRHRTVAQGPHARALRSKSLVCKQPCTQLFKRLACKRPYAASLVCKHSIKVLSRKPFSATQANLAKRRLCTSCCTQGGATRHGWIYPSTAVLEMHASSRSVPAVSLMCRRVTGARLPAMLAYSFAERPFFALYRQLSVHAWRQRGPCAGRRQLLLYISAWLSSANGAWLWVLRRRLSWLDSTRASCASRILRQLT